MTISTDTLASPQDQTESRGLPAWLEVAIIAAVDAAIIISANLLAIPYGGPAALIVSVLLITVFLRLRGETWKDFGFKGPNTLSSFALGSLVAVGVFISAVAMNGVVQLVLNAVLEDGVQRTYPDVSTLLNYIIIMVIVWTTAAFAEEMVFRGFFITRMADIFGRTTAGWTVAVLAPAVLFGLGHAYQGFAGIIITGCVGVVFGVWYLIGRRNLLPLIIAHGIINTFGMTIIFLVGQGIIQVEGLNV